MFVSKEDLKLHYGVDMEIGKFFVDRKVPANNFYWKERYLYIIPMPGYLFIPIYADLQRRIGLPVKEILSEAHIVLLEQILDCIGKEEFTGQTHQQHVNECIDIIKPVCKNKAFLEELIAYFSGAPSFNIRTNLAAPYSALLRVDTYLFALCFFEFNDAIKARLIDAWHALMNFYLVLDDLDDIKEDWESKEPNAIIEAGLTEQGAAGIQKILRDSYDTMNAINPVFANRMDFSLQHVNVNEIVEAYLKQNP